MPKKPKPTLVPSPVAKEFRGIADELANLDEEIKASHYLLDKRMKADNLTEQELVDLGIVHTEMAARLDDLRKECNARTQSFGLRLARWVATRALNNPETDGNAVGAYGTASPDIQHKPVLPRRNSPEMYELLIAMGVNEDAAQARLLVPHWTQFIKWLAELAEQGKNPPYGMTSKPEVTCKFRKKKNG